MRFTWACIKIWALFEGDFIFEMSVVLCTSIWSTINKVIIKIWWCFSYKISCDRSGSSRPTAGNTRLHYTPWVFTDHHAFPKSRMFPPSSLELFFKELWFIFGCWSGTSSVKWMNSRNSSVFNDICLCAFSLEWHEAGGKTWATC